MEVKKAALAAVGVKLSQYPEDGRPEIAFVGKSNVGKSTLINAMMGRKSLARTSGSPGKTRTINFYDIDEKLYFVDLPGYGYAKAPKTEIEKWGHMIEEYLHKREALCGIILLIDIRHAPGENDIMMYEWLRHYGYDIIIAATKADKLKRAGVGPAVSALRKSLGLREGDVVIPFSGVAKVGMEELWTEIEGLMAKGESKD